MENIKWSPNSWKNFECLQQPDWNNKILEDVLLKLKNLPALVFSGETRNLSEDLLDVYEGGSFVLQVGNCAESFDECNGRNIHNFLRIFLQMSCIFELLSGKSVIKIGRIAGQYAKPRSKEKEFINDQELYTYRGDMVNSYEKTLDERTPDPKRLLEGYFKSVSTLNLLRAFNQGGYLDIENFNDWSKHPQVQDFLQNNIKKIELENLSSGRVYISHEGLLLDYESCFARIDTTVTQKWYSTSAHTLWIGERTRSSTGAHVEFFSGVSNPIGVKISHNFEIEDIKNLLLKLNPRKEKSRIIFIIRMGKDNIRIFLPKLIRGVQNLGYNIIWMCDPMHGNTKSKNGLKFRNFDDIYDEVSSFIDICHCESVIPGGIHLEITSDDVTECIGGLVNINLEDLQKKYESKVDPRLNASQSLEIISKISKKIKSYV